MFELYERQIISFTRLRRGIVDFRRNSSSSVLWKKGSVDDVSRQRHMKRRVLTLDPSKMISLKQSICDISLGTRLRFSSSNMETAPRVHLQRIDGCPVFPEDTRGVLYYHSNPTLPPIAGEVRFRICDRLEDFDRGFDLHVLKRPWSLSLLRIVHTPNFATLRQMLLLEGLVDTQLMSDVSRLPPKLQDRLLLFHISQPFVLDLAQCQLEPNLVTRHSCQKVKFPNLFTDRRQVQTLLYTGLVKVRFELSNLPQHRHLGPTLVLRFLDFLTQIKPLIPGYDGYVVEPKPGQFLQRRSRLLAQPKVWAYPLNKRTFGPAIKDFITATLK